MIRYKQDENRWMWWTEENMEGNDVRSYFTTNDDGEGVFLVDSYRNERRQLEGTCQFSLRGLKNPKAKIRRWMDRA